MKIIESLDVGAVQKRANFVDLGNNSKIHVRVSTKYLLAKIGLYIAENEPPEVFLLRNPAAAC